MLIREKRLISLNSANATRSLNSTYNSNVVFDFPSILSAEESIEYIEGGVQSAQIPASFYNVDVDNNGFNYRVSSVDYSITVTPGSYNYNTLISELAIQFANNGHTFTFSLNRATNILTMNFTSGGTWNQIRPSSIYYILGLAQGTTYTIVGTSFIFPELFNVINPKKLKIFSTNLAIDSYDSVGSATSNLIETLSVNAAPFGLILYNNIDSTYGHLKTNYLSTIDIQIKNEFGSFVNFNNIDWTMTIVLILYKRLDATSRELVQPGNEVVVRL